MDGTAVVGGGCCSPGQLSISLGPRAPQLSQIWCLNLLSKTVSDVHGFCTVAGGLSSNVLCYRVSELQWFENLGKKLTKSSSSENRKINTSSLKMHEFCLACQQTCRYHYTFLIKARRPLSCCPKFKFRLWILHWLGLKKKMHCLNNISKVLFFPLDFEEVRWIRSLFLMFVFQGLIIRCNSNKCLSRIHRVTVTPLFLKLHLTLLIGCCS